MNTPDLRDIHLPDTISWWPPAPGWWLLALLVVLVALIIPRVIKYIKRKSLNKLALLELTNIEQTFNTHKNNDQLVQDISVLLRRICLSYKPRQQVASLTGKDWIDYLNTMTENNYFSEQLGQTLLNAPYQKHAHFNADELITSCKNWIEHLPRRSVG